MREQLENKPKCKQCQGLAVGYSVNKRGRKTYCCEYHLPGPGPDFILLKHHIEAEDQNCGLPIPKF